jgi:hypothetical protein
MATFTRATKTQSRLRLALIGPAGSGKTYSALVIGTALGERVAVIDTERGSASKYADKFTFDVFEPENFAPELYIDAIQAAERAGYDVLIIDSLSHAWSGKGGILEFVDQETRRSNTHNAYTDGWRKATPKHNLLVDTMLQTHMHLIATMRSKTEYILEKDEKGRTIPRKIGMQPVQRDGLEYEFDVVGDMTLDHEYIISKSRCELLTGAIIVKPNASFAETLTAWLSDGVPLPSSNPSEPSPLSISPAPSFSTSTPKPAPLGPSRPAASAASSPAFDSPQPPDSPDPLTAGDPPLTRRSAWSSAQLQPILDAKLASNPNQVIAALNLSILPESAHPEQCLAWANDYACARSEGFSPEKAAALANTRYTDSLPDPFSDPA